MKKNSALALVVFVLTFALSLQVVSAAGSKHPHSDRPYGSISNLNSKKENQISRANHFLNQLQNKKISGISKQKAKGSISTQVDNSALIQQITELKAKVSSDTTRAELAADMKALLALLKPKHN